MEIRLINSHLLSGLYDKAASSERLRQAFDLRTTPEDGSQRMLNALQPGTKVSIHRHLASSETVIILRGRIRWLFYDDQGRITESTELWSDGDVRMLNVEKGRWHSLECQESGSVLFDAKDGPYHPLEEDEIMNIK